MGMMFEAHWLWRHDSVPGSVFRELCDILETSGFRWNGANREVAAGSPPRPASEVVEWQEELLRFYLDNRAANDEFERRVCEYSRSAESNSASVEESRRHVASIRSGFEQARLLPHRFHGMDSTHDLLREVRVFVTKNQTIDSREPPLPDALDIWAIVEERVAFRNYGEDNCELDARATAAFTQVADKMYERLSPWLIEVYFEFWSHPGPFCRGLSPGQWPNPPRAVGYLSPRFLQEYLLRAEDAPSHARHLPDGGVLIDNLSSRGAGGQEEW